MHTFIEATDIIKQNETQVICVSSEHSSIVFKTEESVPEIFFGKSLSWPVSFEPESLANAMHTVVSSLQPAEPTPLSLNARMNL